MCKMGKKEFCIFESGSKQYFGTPGDKVELDAEGLSKIEKILFLKKDDHVSIGTPYIKGASVLLEFIGEKKGKKVVSFRKKRRKGYKRKVGHRQKFFVYKIAEIKV